MFDPFLLTADVQWAELDYLQARQRHVALGTEQTLAAAVAAWTALTYAQAWLHHYAMLVHQAL